MDANALAFALAGLVVGTGATLAVLRARRAAPAAQELRLTSTWRLGELAAPLVLARDVDAEVPDGSRVVVSGTVSAGAFANAQVRLVPHVGAEFAVDTAAPTPGNPAGGPRALLFTGGVRPGAQALVVTDPTTVARLRAEAEAAWARGEPYHERRPLADAAGRHGLVVETQGTVQDVLPYHGAFLLRLEDAGTVLGVQVAKEPSELRGQRVLVRGRMDKDKGGYPVLVAQDLRRLA